MISVQAQTLAAIAAQLDESQLIGDSTTLLTSVSTDSRAAQPGSLFVALPGQHVDGAHFMRDAIARGAAALLLQHDAREQLPSDIPACLVPDVRLALARLAAYIFGNPAKALRIIGITGTNGKTTTSFMIAAILAATSHTTLRIGTLGASWNEQHIYLGYTTPPPLELHRLFAQARTDNVDVAVMEMSSHALALDRLAEVPIETGIFTNLTRDHLDFHHSMEAYAAAKERLCRIARNSIFNVDDPMGETWHQRYGGISYAIDAAADVRAEHVRLNAQGSEFSVDGVRFLVPLPGRFNISNALAAIAFGKSWGISLEVISQQLATFRGVPGRMERFAHENCTVFVDYAHTPDALGRVLSAVNPDGQQHVTVVFGCGGERDAGKRPAMGAIAQRMAQRVIVTNDNPRSEDPAAIARAVLSGASTPLECILDRREAITRAILEAPRGGIVVVAGKGAETTQIIDQATMRFDDRREVERILLERPASRA